MSEPEEKAEAMRLALVESGMEPERAAEIVAMIDWRPPTEADIRRARELVDQGIIKLPGSLR